MYTPEASVLPRTFFASNVTSYFPAVLCSFTKVATSCPVMLYTFNVTSPSDGIAKRIVVEGLKGLG